MTAGPVQDGPSTAELLNAQTGQLAWAELARHFARGVVVVVAPGEDLVAIAESMVGDDASALESLAANGSLERASDEHARGWQARGSSFWAVVVAPWVVVQEILDEDPAT